jgi:tetratricopeptide (TPR) repeat protein
MRLPFRLHVAQQLCMLSFPLSVLAACTLLPLAVDSTATAPVLDGFGATTLVPSQANDGARRLFAQGIAQAYAFNEDEAVRAFKAALAQDPDCAMCAWGVALQMGPNINSTGRSNVREAMQYVGYAIAHSKGASRRDQALIESLALRYGHSAARTMAPPPGAVCRTPGSTEPADPLDIAYAAHMQQLALRFPSDPDVLTLYAEAEMIATRGDWWDQASGKPAGRIGELATMLEAGLARHPDHVGLNHYMIHAVDATSVASRAERSADVLGKLAPKSPHLLHMPSHTYANLGRYADATRVNQLAIAADESMMLELKNQSFKDTRDWRRHNAEFQVYAAVMEGRGDVALEAARALAGRTHGDHEYAEFMRSLPMVTLLNLQRWNALLAEPMPKGDKGMAKVMGEMARGIAMARTGQAGNARAALDKLTPNAVALLANHKGDGDGAKMIQSLVQSAQAQLKAEIALADGRIDDALKLQAEAVQAAAHVEKNEPPMLANGPRQRLGGMQLRARRFAAAEQSFRDDLAIHPRNGWAYRGLEAAFKGQGKNAEAQTAQRDVATTWPLADKALRGAL